MTALLRDPPVPIDHGPYRDTALLADHIDLDWFGIKPDAGDESPTSRYWYYWQGDAQAIVRETMIRTIEVALGLDHGEAGRDAGRPHAVHGWTGPAWRTAVASAVAQGFPGR